MLRRHFPKKAGERVVWPLVCWTIATVLAVPVLAIFWSVTQDSDGIWEHLAATVLSDYVSNTLVLSAGVGFGTLLICVTTAWLVTTCRFTVSYTHLKLPKKRIV